MLFLGGNFGELEDVERKVVYARDRKEDEKGKGMTLVMWENVTILLLFYLFQLKLKMKREK